MTGLENLWHMDYMLMVCINDCTTVYSYVCMHVGDPDHTSIVGGMCIYSGQRIAHHRVSDKDREIASALEIVITACRETKYEYTQIKPTRRIKV
jgi:hypothetical protein